MQLRMNDIEKDDALEVNRYSFVAMQCSLVCV
jgi:hypothetical protein